MLAASLGGLSFGLDRFSAGFDDATQGLAGNVGDVVMTEDAVDSPPRASHRVPASYPARARSRAINGYVTLTMVVNADGSVRDVEVLESSPAGMFDQAAKEAVSRWRFEPAMYEGQPVATRARQTVRFELE